MKYLIVGTGLSAWATYVSLQSIIETHDSITIIDPGKRFKKINTFASKSGKKTKFGSSHMFDIDDTSIKNTAEINLSYGHAGLSEVWGAGIRLWEKDDLESTGLSLEEFCTASESLLKVMPHTGELAAMNIPGPIQVMDNSHPLGSGDFDLLRDSSIQTNMRVERTALAIKTKGINGCRGCGLCLSGCPYNSIFETGTIFDSLAMNGFVQMVMGKVQALSKFGTGVGVSYLDNFGETQSVVFDKVFLSAGAIGTPAILMRSGLISEPLELVDSQVFYFLGLKKPSKKNHKVFALSQITLSSKVSSNEEFSASLYQCNAEVRMRISNLIADKFFGLKLPLPSFLDRVLFLGIGFLDSSKSGKVRMEFSSEDALRITPAENKSSKSVVRKVMKIISKSIRKSGFLLFPEIFVMPVPGAGYHCGGALPLGGKYVDEQGRLRDFEAVSVADVSILPFIKPGPHTFTAMCLNFGLIQRLAK